MNIADIPFDRVCGTSSSSSQDEVRLRENFKRFLDYIRVRATDHFVYPPEILRVDEITIGTIGNFSASVGKPKSRKTFNVSAIVAALISGHEVLHYNASMPKSRTRVLYVDTEQSHVHCLKVLKRILRLSGLPEDTDSQALEFLMLRAFTPQQRRNIIDTTLRLDSSIGFVVIDGIRDLVNDINSPGESIEIINDLMRWTNVYNLHIHTVLHLNKSDDNTRGHLGTELNNKAETVIKVTKCEFNPDVSEVEPLITREREFSSFAFRIDDKGLPVVTAIDNHERIVKLTQKTLSEESHRRVLDRVFAEGKVGSYSVLVNSISKHYAEVGFRRGRTSFVLLIKLFMQKGVIRKMNKEYFYVPENLKLIKEE